MNHQHSYQAKKISTIKKIIIIRKSCKIKLDPKIQIYQSCQSCQEQITAPPPRAPPCIIHHQLHDVKQHGTTVPYPVINPSPTFISAFHLFFYPLELSGWLYDISYVYGSMIMATHSHFCQHVTFNITEADCVYNHAFNPCMTHLTT